MLQLNGSEFVKIIIYLNKHNKVVIINFKGLFILHFPEYSLSQVRLSKKITYGILQ
jgi:hypothetical protein